MKHQTTSAYLGVLYYKAAVVSTDQRGQNYVLGFFGALLKTLTELAPLTGLCCCYSGNQTAKIHLSFSGQ